MQKTLLKPAQLSGFGFWRCEDAAVTLEPAAEDTGIVFIRDDLPETPVIPAELNFRVNTPHRTSLGISLEGNKNVQVDMVEHVMAALFAMEITNCRVHVTAQELPALDGSALPYVEAINEAGVKSQNKPGKKWRVTAPIRVGNDAAYMEVRPPEPEVLVGTIDYELNYPHNPAIGFQEFTTPLFSETLREDVVPARTFATQQEAVTLQAAGLCRRVTPQNCLVFTGEGVLENSLRFNDECARHKILDFVGDMYLGGIEWVGRFHCVGSGHDLNYQMLQELIRQREKQI